MIPERAGSHVQPCVIALPSQTCQTSRRHRRCRRRGGFAEAFCRDLAPTTAGLRLGLDLLPQFAASIRGLPEEVPPAVRGPPAETSGRSYLEFPARSESIRDKAKGPELVRVRLSVPYRVHSRQMLCIGGSQIPFGWSFLSIAKVPMTWTEGDVWQAEVRLHSQELSCPEQACEQGHACVSVMGNA